MIELFGGTTQFLALDLFDPSTGNEITEIPTTVRSNPELQPEDSRSFSGGIVYTPKFVLGLTLTIDLFNIESKGRVIQPDTQNLLDRDFLGQLLPNERVLRDADGNVTSIELAYQNSGSQKTRGIDLGLQYQIATPWGTFSSVTQATYLESFEFAVLPGESEIELRSGTFGSDDGYLKWRANSRLDWDWHGFGLGITAHYRDGFHEILFPSFEEHWVKQTWFFDVRASYGFHFAAPTNSDYAKDYDNAQPGTSALEGSGQPTWKRLLNDTTITVGCNNLFDHDPPTAATGYNFPGSLYDATGRFVYVSLRKKF